MASSSLDRAEKDDPVQAQSKHASSSRFRSARNFLLYLYLVIRTYCQTAWIRLNRWLHRQATVGAAAAATHHRGGSSRQHRIVIIGDGLALGAGDGGVVPGTALGAPGIAPHLQKAADRNASLRRQWDVVNCGEMNSTAEAWLPPGSKTSRKYRDGTPGSVGGLFERVFGPGRVGRDAEVVVIMLGTTDVAKRVGGPLLPPSALRRTMSDMPYPASELAPLAKNIGAIAAALQNQGRRVCVVDLPTVGIPSSNRDAMIRLNQQIKQVLLAANEGRGAKKNGEQSMQFISPIQIYALGSNHYVMRPECRSFDSLYLNRKGYKQLALNLFENAGIKEMMVGIEWRVWKSHFDESSPKKTR